MWIGLFVVRQRKVQILFNTKLKMTETSIAIGDAMNLPTPAWMERGEAIDPGYV